MKRRRLLQWLAASACTTPLAWPAQASQWFCYGAQVVEVPQRVFAAGAPAAVLLHCLVPERLLGWPWPVAHGGLLPARSAALPVVGRLAGRGSTISLEQLLALQPQLVVDLGSSDPSYRSLAQRSQALTGIDYCLFDADLAQSPQLLHRVGKRLGVVVRAEQLAVAAEAILRRTRQAGLQGSAYLARGSDGLETGLRGSIHAQCLEVCGLDNVASVAGQHGLARISLEQLMVWQPQRILCQEEQVYRHIRQSAAWSALAAVRAGEVYLAPAQPFGWLDGPPSINRLLGLEWLQALYQPAERGLLLQRVSDFHQLFYGQALSPAQLRGLLGDFPGVWS